MRRIQEEIRGLYYVKEAEEDFPETWSKLSAKVVRHDAADIKCE